MKELKATHIIMVYNGEIYEDFETVPCTQLYYRKDEADKVIEEKDAEIARLKAIRKVHVEAIESMGAGLLQDEKEARHNKYKRCLAMARWCHNQWEIYSRDSYNWELEDNAVDSLRNKADIMRKWKKRWMELSEQFKPNSTAN